MMPGLRLVVFALVVLSLVMDAHPVAAQLTVHYEGFQAMNGKRISASAAFAIDRDRVAKVIEGADSVRILYFAKERRLCLVDDRARESLEIDVADGGIAGGAMKQVEEQLAGLPPAQQAQVRAMMGAALAQAKQAPPVEYRWTETTETIAGYPTTLVEIFDGGKRTAAYWGSPASDFRLQPAEAKCVEAMDQALSVSRISVVGSAGGPRAFEWDPEKEGFPVRMQCYEDTTTTLSLQLVRTDRKPLAKKLFEVPKGYRKRATDDAR